MRLIFLLRPLRKGPQDSSSSRVTEVVVRLYRTGNFLQKILSCYSGTTQGSETKDTSYEIPIIELLELVMKEGVAVS